MIVYHGSTVVVRQPDVLHSYRRLDFGKGFYTTTVREQAERWARRKADILNADHAIVNLYQMSDDTGNMIIKTFDDDLMDWIDFVCQCRDGGNEYQKFDVIIGKVANDKVYRVVDMYHTGIWDKPRVLQEIKVYPTYDQIAFVSQEAIDRLLIFDSSMEV